jgi:hypothetical protein
MYQPWEVHIVEEFPTDKDDDDDNDDDYHPPKHDVVVKKEVKNANMPGADHLPPEYQEVMVAGYDKVLMQLALAASHNEEDVAFPDLWHAMELMGMVADVYALLFL